MIYTIYNEYRKKYHKAQKNYNEILTEKEKLFGITQPKAVSYDHEAVSSGSNPQNQFDRYLILKEEKRVDERLEEAKAILEDRQALFEMIEKELEQSKDILDVVYWLRYVKKYKVVQVADEVGYSTVQVNRFLHKINENLRKNQHDTK